jgi:hypothetical protein
MLCLKRFAVALALFLLTGFPAMAEVNLPPGAQCYFDAVAARDAAAVGACIAGDGWVLDVNRKIEGRDAITAWAETEVIGGTYTLHELTYGKDGVQILLSFTPPGATSGFRANYVISLRGGKIATMALSYA